MRELLPPPSRPTPSAALSALWLSERKRLAEGRFNRTSCDDITATYDEIIAAPPAPPAWDDGPAAEPEPPSPPPASLTEPPEPPEPPEPTAISSSPAIRRVMAPPPDAALVRASCPALVVVNRQRRLSADFLAGGWRDDAPLKRIRSEAFDMSALL